MVAIWSVAAVTVVLTVIVLVTGPRKVACKLGFHGRTLERLHGNRFHTDYRCSACKREVIRWGS